MDKRKVVALGALGVFAVGLGVLGYINRAMLKRKTQNALRAAKSRLHGKDEALTEKNQETTDDADSPVPAVENAAE